MVIQVVVKAVNSVGGILSGSERRGFLLYFLLSFRQALLHSAELPYSMYFLLSAWDGKDLALLPKCSHSRQGLSMVWLTIL